MLMSQPKAPSLPSSVNPVVSNTLAVPESLTTDKGMVIRLLFFLYRHFICFHQATVLSFSFTSDFSQPVTDNTSK